MASSSSSTSQWSSGELILAVSRGQAIAAYDALTGHVVAELPAANTPRHGLAVVAAGPGSTAAFVAASHVCPATGACSIRLLQWRSASATAAPAHELPVPEPVAPLVAAPHGSHLLAGGTSGRVYALALPSGDVARAFRAHRIGAVSCLALSDDGSLLLSGGEDGAVAAFLLVDVLDAEAPRGSCYADLAVYRVAAAHTAAVTCVACGRGGCHAVVATASADGTCKVWRLADGGHLRTLALPCTALSLALDPTSSALYAGGSDGRVHVASLDSPATTAVTSSTSHHANDSDNNTNNAAVVAVAMANGCRNLVSCAEDGEVRVWDLTHGSLLLLAHTFWLGGVVSGALVVKRPVSAGEVARAGGGGEGFRVRDDDVAWTRACEVAKMEDMLRSSEEDRASSVALLEKNLDIHKRCLRLMLREATALANGDSHDGVHGGNVTD